MNRQLSVQDVLGLLDGDVSVLENSSDSEDNDSMFDINDVNTGTESDDSVATDPSDDDVPLATFAQKDLKSPSQYKWKSGEFTLPEDLQFIGNAEIPNYATMNGDNATPYTFLKLFITDEMLTDIADHTNQYSVEKDSKCANTTSQEMERLGFTF